MPLTLVTGPANSAKAGAVLGGLRARLDDEPILVVPAFADVEHAQRELAERGAIFGARVLRFDRLFGTVADRVGYGESVASELQRELFVEAAVSRARLTELAGSAGQPGFVRAAARFIAELQRARVEPARFTQALRQWAPEGRRAYADEVAAIYRGYRQALDEAGMADRELFAWRALDALRREPGRWGSTPLFVYGFDDFTKLELDALETISRHCGADVTVSLPFEAGRPAFKALAAVHAELVAIATDRVDLPPLDDHYAGDAREDLHHIERGLFELEAPARRSSGGALRLHQAGGERAEVELAAREVLELLRGGTEPGGVAVVLRDPARYASLLEQVFGAYGIPYSIDRSLALAHTGLGRGLLALVRCAALEGSADDLLLYLRTPRLLRNPRLADRLEADVRQEGAQTAVRARELWEERGDWTLGELDRLAGARDMAAFLTELSARLEYLFAGPDRRQAPLLAADELEEPRAFRAAHDALRELSALPARQLELLTRQRVHDVLADVRVRVGDDPQPDRVQVASPQAIRARRFDAVFVCGLQEGEFPRAASPDPFLPDDDRSAIAQRSGLRLPEREDQLERERYLFYVCCSRAERTLVLSSRVCDEEGNPESESFLVEDVKDLFEPLEPRRRGLSEVTWALGQAPTVDEWDRAEALAGPRRAEAHPGPLSAEPLLEQLAAREAFSASALESFADCPVKWLMERLLDAETLEPDPEAMVRGRYAHRVLEATFKKLRERTGDRRVTPANLAEAERILLTELREQSSEFPLSPKLTRVRAAVRRLEFDLLRFLRYEAESDSRFEPEELELQFKDVIVGDVRVRGTIDRVDTWKHYALVRDYKSGKNATDYKVSSWDKANRFQVALYMIAAQEKLGLEPAGGVYMFLGGDERRGRGMVASDVDGLGDNFFDGDRRGPEEFSQMLDWARGRITDAAGRMRRGELACKPDSCGWRGGCSHPSVCRIET